MASQKTIDKIKKIRAAKERRRALRFGPRTSTSTSRPPSRETKNTLSATVFDAKTKKKKGFLVDGKIVKELPKSKSKRVTKSNVSRPKTTGVITFTDTKTGVETKTKVNTKTGKFISSTKKQKILSNKIPNQKKITTFQNIQEIQRINEKQRRDRSINPELFKQRGKLAVNVDGESLMVPIETTRQKKQREELISQFNKKILNKVSENLNDVQNSPRYKALVKQTITPTELKELERELKKENYGLEKQQLELLKNAPKNIGLAVFEFGRDILVMPGEIVTGAYKYGVNAQKRADQKNENILKVFGRDLEKVGSSAVQIGKFIRKNPVQSFAIAGAFGSKVAGVSGKAFINNPIKFTTRVLLEVFSGAILLKAGKLTKINKLAKFIPKKYVKNNFELVTSSKGKDKIVGVMEGVDFLGQKFIGEYKLIKQGEDFVGSVKYKIGNKTNVERIVLKDKDSYYLNTVTKEKIPKKLVGLTDRKITIKEQTFTPRGAEKTVIVKGGSGVGRNFDVQTVITKNIIAANRKTQKTIKTTRTSVVQEIKAITDKGKQQKFKRSIQLTKDIIKKYSKKPYSLSKKEIKAVQDFFDLVNWDKTIIGGLEKFRKIAKALGLTNIKTVDVLKELKKTPKGTKKVVTIKKSAKGVIEIGTKKPFEIKLGRGLVTNKKARLGNSNQVEIIKKPVNITTKVNNKLKKEIIPIPIISVPTKLPTGFKNLLQTTRTLNNFKQILKRQETFLNAVRKGQISPDKVNKYKQIQEKDLSRIQERTKKTSQVKIKDQKRVKKQPQVTKSKQITKKKPIKKPTVKSLNFTPSSPPKKLKLPNLTFGSKLLTGESLKFDARYKEKGKIKILKLGLPKNKALRRVGNLADTTTQRSIEIFIVGTTKAKDISRPPILGKFRPKISANNKVLSLVEKSKNAIDTRGEKKGLSISKKLKNKNDKQSRQGSKRSVRKV